MRLSLVLMIFLYGCTNSNDSQKVGVIRMTGTLDVPAGLTPLQTHYFKVNLKSILPSDMITDDYQFQGRSTYLTIIDGFKWSFLREAEMVENKNGDPGAQPIFATDYYSETNSSELLLLPFQENLPANLVLNSSPSFFLKLTPFTPNSQTFKIRIDVEINVLN